MLGNHCNKWQAWMRMPSDRAFHFKQEAERANWNWGEVMNSQSLLPMTYFFQQNCTSHNLSPKRATDRGASIQIPEPVGELFSI